MSNPNPPLDSMNRELSAASADLVGNGDFLRAVLAGSGDCIKVLDLDGRLQFMSEGGKRVMEVDDFGPLKGCFWPDFWTDAGNRQAAAAIADAKAGKTARFRGPASTARGTPKYWDVQVAPIFGANGEVSQLLSISKDITDEWDAQQRERFLMEELEHRAKNMFAMVLAIAQQTFRGEAYKSALEVYNARVLALAKAHDIAKESNWANVPVQKVIEAALASYRHAEKNFSISSPAFSVAPRQALSLTLAINELATNAIKYGALSSEKGKVDITLATLPAREAFTFTWREHDGPPVSKPSRQGFGSRVIQEFMAKDFGGAVRISYDPAGLICEMKAPLPDPRFKAG